MVDEDDSDEEVDVKVNDLDVHSEPMLDDNTYENDVEEQTEMTIHFTLV